MLRMIKALLPKGEAFDIVHNDLNQLKFWRALCVTFQSFKDYIDLQYLDLFPQTTRELPAWEEVFGLFPGGLTEQQRRDNLAAAWKETGGQTKAYIQGALRSKGFDVYVYDWWEPGTKIPRDPNACEYVLKNKITYSAIDNDISTGASNSESGGVISESGGPAQVIIGIEPVNIPEDVEKWKNFIYISGASYGEPISIPAERKDEFDALILKLRPLEKWVGINPVITYILAENGDYIISEDGYRVVEE